MAVARAVGRAILWLLFGLAGSLAILIITSSVIDLRGYPRLQSGGLVFTDFWDRGYVQAGGTWVFEDDTKQAFPRQTTEIKCYRETKKCHSAQAEIAFGHVDRADRKLSDHVVGQSVHRLRLERSVMRVLHLHDFPLHQVRHRSTATEAIVIRGIVVRFIREAHIKSFAA